MINKLALRVCPMPGCPVIGNKQGDRCKVHDKLTIRVIYVRDELRATLASVNETVNKLGKTS